MKPVVIGNAELWLGDCREILPTLPKVDAVITDPPYGIGFKHSGKSSGVPGRKTQPQPNAERIIGDDKDFDPKHLLIAKHVLIFGADHFKTRLPSGGRMLGWDKTGGGKTPKTSFSDMEFAWTNYGTQQNIFHYMWKGILQDGEKGEQKYHLSQKPIALMHWCLEQAKVPKLATVLDPYMGSGGTGVACIQTGRSFIGIEIDEKHFSVACRRIEDAQRQQPLIPHEQPQPTQSDLLDDYDEITRREFLGATE